MREAREAVENETADHNQAMRVLVAQMVADNLLDHANFVTRSKGGVEAQRLLRKAREAVENETADHSQEVRVQTAQKAKANMAATGNTKWDEKFTLAVQYKDEHKQWPPLSQGKLGNWVSTQRKQKKKFDKGEKSLLTQERIDKLDEVGFVWEQNKWHEKFTLAVQYKDEHKQWPPQSQGVLGTWVDRQRTQKKKFDKGEKSQLTQERIDKLDEVGFVWNTNDNEWDEKFTLVVQYKDEYEKFPPQSQGVLGTWVDHQRTQKKKFDKDPTTSTLTQERIDKLNKVGFAWNPGKGKGGGGNRRKSTTMKSVSICDSLLQNVQYKSITQQYKPSTGNHIKK